jgi:hypothetical protein
LPSALTHCDSALEREKPARQRDHWLMRLMFGQASRTIVARAYPRVTIALPATAPYFVIVNESLHIPRYRHSIELDLARDAKCVPGIPGTVRSSAVRYRRADGARQRRHSGDLRAASIAFASMLHAVSPILAISVETLIGCATVAVVPAYAPSIAIFILFFQNLFVSIL